MKKNPNAAFMKGDIHDSKKDEKQMQEEEIIFDLPEVKDIPGQENIRPPKLNGFADVTISSDDEEGKGLLDFDEEDDMEELDNETNVTTEEKDLLEQSVNSMGSEDDETLAKSTLDNTDEDGELLNEENDMSGDDLDVPGAEDDDANEAIGEEDEENNSYSLGADKD
ncbi:MAG: hypothetical protein ABIO81_03445 [Ginsengibacter sp.]